MVNIVVLTGPTAVGKTALALRMAEHWNMPVINADSRQLYRGMEIGTAAPTKEERSRARHYLFGTLSPSDYYNAALYRDDVERLLNTELKNCRRVLITGGSMMYIDAVVKGLDYLPRISAATRDYFSRLLSDEGVDALASLLKSEDPRYAAEADLKNARRVVHALEIIKESGQPYSLLRRGGNGARKRVIKIGLTRPRDDLYKLIDRRVEMMMEKGLLEEARALYPEKGANALNTVGYKELFDYFDGLCSLDTAIEKIKTDTHRYARKQLTWLRRDIHCLWYHPDETDDIINQAFDV